MAWFKYDENALVIIRQVIWKENVTPRRWQLIITGQKTIYLVVDFLIIESPQLRPYNGWVTRLIPPLLGLNGLESYGFYHDNCLTKLPNDPIPVYVRPMVKCFKKPGTIE